MSEVRVKGGKISASILDRDDATVALRVSTDVDATFDLYQGDIRVATIRGPFDGQVVITLESSKTKISLRADEVAVEEEAQTFVPAPAYSEPVVEAVEVVLVTPVEHEPVVAETVIETEVEAVLKPRKSAKRGAAAR